MESHISHIFADLFTSRPKAYSKKGLIQLLKLRLLKINNKNIKDIYFKQFKLKDNNNSLFTSYTNNNYERSLFNPDTFFNFLYKDNKTINSI